MVQTCSSTLFHRQNGRHRNVDGRRGFRGRFPLLGLLLAGLLVAQGASARVAAHVPLSCSRDEEQTFNAIVSMPPAGPRGSTVTIRIDGISSGQISRSGLKYIHDMQTDFVLPPGLTYVEGSAHIVPETGTTNVRVGARVTHDAAGIHLLLPAHVNKGSAYTAPSVEFQARLEAPPGSRLPLAFEQYSLKAKAVLVGDVDTSCNPTPKPYTLATTRVQQPTAFGRRGSKPSEH